MVSTHDLSHAKLQDVIPIISEYTDMVHDCKETQHLQSIWELCDILYFPSHRMHLATELNHWINEYYPIQQEPSWDSAIQHLLRGNMDQAVLLLETLSKDSHHLVDLIQQYTSLPMDNETVYMEQWKAWHDDCISRFESYVAVSAEDALPYIKDAFHVLIGQPVTMGNMIERLLATLLYARPQMSVASLNQVAQTMNIHSDDKPFKMACLLLQGLFDDAFDVYGHDIWLQTHLGQALIAVGVYPLHALVSKQTEQVLDPVFYGIQQYATMIAEKYDMWKEAVVYLTLCQANKEIWIQQLLSPVDHQDMDTLASILDLAVQYKLPTVQKYLHQALGQRHEQANKIQLATIEYGKAQDWTSLDRLAHAAFQQYLKTGQLDQVVMDMTDLHSSPCYSLLIQYQQFKQCIQDKAFKQAASLFWSLIHHDHLPSQFESVLLIDNLVILKESAHYYVASQLMECIDLFKSLDTHLFHTYYNMIQHTQLSTEIITAKIRERLVFKAATAPLE
ncbi:nucleoporin Nup85-like protein [Gilbertella persicaria]|uniref:nucleoporin Nup85-like protein n=1 Tax=Gilbertella persicaria TaxID=101096 RepID=UPI00221E9070|nr:nucleoporin Nup85-like protein [Gilbertella persicaria]KAI8067009.1 nucleoporin Nup85-like protein [Gilbertella persicaria]